MCSVFTSGHLWAALVGPMICNSVISSVELKKTYVSFKNVTGFVDSSAAPTFLYFNCTLPWLMKAHVMQHVQNGTHCPIKHAPSPVNPISNSSTIIPSLNLKSAIHFVNSITPSIHIPITQTTLFLHSTISHI